jgi:hypothetical protein
MFRRGDIVRCVEAGNGVLSLSRMYAVMGGGRDPVVINDLGFEARYHRDRFQLVEPVSRQKGDNPKRGVKRIRVELRRDHN